MSEHAIKSPTTSRVFDETAAGTGSYPLLAKGKVAPVAGNSLPKKATQQVDAQLLARKLNTEARAIGHQLRFKVDLENGPTVIQVLDRETGEIIRQIPSEEAVAALRDSGSLRIHLIDALV